MARFARGTGAEMETRLAIAALQTMRFVLPAILLSPTQSTGFKSKKLLGSLRATPVQLLGNL